MPKSCIPKLLAPLLVLSSVPLLTACGDERPQVALPPAERLAGVPYPAIPAGEAVCDGAPCLSDRETGALLTDFAKALDEANARIGWLRDWAAGMAKGR